MERGCTVLPRNLPVGGNFGTNGCNHVEHKPGETIRSCSCVSETELCNTGYWALSGLREPQLTGPPLTIAPPPPSPPPPRQPVHCYRCAGAFGRYASPTGCFLSSSLSSYKNPQSGNCLNTFAAELQTPQYRNHVPVCLSTWSQVDDPDGISQRIVNYLSIRVVVQHYSYYF